MDRSDPSWRDGADSADIDPADTGSVDSRDESSEDRTRSGRRSRERRAARNGRDEATGYLLSSGEADVRGRDGGRAAEGAGRRRAERASADGRSGSRHGGGGGDPDVPSAVARAGRTSRHGRASDDAAPAPAHRRQPAFDETALFGAPDDSGRSDRAGESSGVSSMLDSYPRRLRYDAADVPAARAGRSVQRYPAEDMPSQDDRSAGPRYGTDDTRPARNGRSAERYVADDLSPRNARSTEARTARADVPAARAGRSAEDSSPRNGRSADRRYSADDARVRNGRSADRYGADDPVPAGDGHQPDVPPRYRPDPGPVDRRTSARVPDRGPAVERTEVLGAPLTDSTPPGSTPPVSAPLASIPPGSTPSGSTRRRDASVDLTATSVTGRRAARRAAERQSAEREAAATALVPQVAADPEDEPGSTTGRRPFGRRRAAPRIPERRIPERRIPEPRISERRIPEPRSSESRSSESRSSESRSSESRIPEPRAPEPDGPETRLVEPATTRRPAITARPDRAAEAPASPYTPAEPIRDPALSTTDVVKVHGQGARSVTALDGITVEVARSRFTAIMGASGSGKSTLLHCLAGLDKPTRGKVLLGTTDLTKVSERKLTRLRRDRIGFVFQSYDLLPQLTVRQNILLPIEVAGAKLDEQWLNTVLEALELGDLLRQLPSQLSGGEQQRVAVARAVLPRPEVVLADEPTGALDAGTTREMVGFLRASVDHLGQTVVMVTHDPLAAQHTDRAVILHAGRLVGEVGKPTAHGVLDALAALAETAAPSERRPSAPARRSDRREGGRWPLLRRRAARHT